MREFDLNKKEKKFKEIELNIHNSNLENQNKLREENTQIFQAIQSNLKEDEIKMKNNKNEYYKKMDRFEELKKNIFKNKEIIEKHVIKLRKLIPILFFMILLTASVYSF